MSETVEIVKLVLAFLGTLFTAWVGYQVVKLNIAATKAAVKVETATLAVKEVKATLENVTVGHDELLNSMADQVSIQGDKIDVAARVGEEAARVGRDNHTLLNSNMGAQLKIGAVALRRLAELTKHPDDLAAASLAEKLLSDHEAKQAVVDKRAEDKGTT